MNRIAIFFGVLVYWIAFTEASRAQEQRILLLPISIQGSYQPITETELNAQIKTEMAAEGLTAVSMPRLKQVPTDEASARSLARKYNADFVAWGAIEFSKESKSLPSGPLGSAGSDGSPYRFQTSSRVLYQVRVSSNCTITLVPADEGKKPLFAHSHLPHIHSATTSATPGSERHQTVESRLSRWCVRTLVSHIQEAINQDH